MTMLRGWGIWLPSHDQELFSQYGPKNGQQQVEANKDRQWGHLPLHREWQKPGDNLFASEAGELHCFQHRAITQGQIVVEKIPVNIKAETDVGSHRQKKAVGPKDAVNLIQAVAEIFFLGKMFEKITGEHHIDQTRGHRPGLGHVL